ncbi:MAG: cytochrome P450, partial [Acidimicrobiales bacterium]
MSRTTLSSATRGAEFAFPEYWADMDDWHRKVAEIRRTDPILKVELDGFEPFWVLTKHADVFAVSRDNNRWINTSRSVLAAEEDTR